MFSQTFAKRNLAREVMQFDDQASADPRPIQQLAELEKDAGDACRRYPGMRRAKGKSGKSKPILD